MASKDAKVGEKRKSSSGTKAKADGKAKKPRMDDSKPPKRPAKEEADDFESFSDEDEDGGVKLDGKSGNAPKAGGDKASAFDRCMFCDPSVNPRLNSTS